MDHQDAWCLRTYDACYLFSTITILNTYPIPIPASSSPAATPKAEAPFPKAPPNARRGSEVEVSAESVVVTELRLLNKVRS
jgi:hypothetical protein